MSDNTLLRRHAERWARDKNRPFDGDLLETVVDLRMHYDERAATSWPAGSVEALLLERWPTHGPLDLPDLQTLQETLETYWRFLRATGRMASGSAAPADLLKEARRALPKMADACSDRTNFSSGRVLQEFGRSIGIRLDEAADLDELNDRLARIQTAWNDLPTAERHRLLPDPTPKTAAGHAMTDIVNSAMREAADLDVDDELADEDGFLDDWEHLLSDMWDGALARSGNLPSAASQARESAYVRACLALADWVGDGREVTKTAVLRPAVAREAYDALGLAEWEREFEQSTAGDDVPELARGLLVDSRKDGWQSARDCMPLDRLWYASAAAGLVQVGSHRAARTPKHPETDIDWLSLGLRLVYAMTHRFGFYDCEPLVALVFSLARVGDGSCDLIEFRRWWHARSLLMQSDQPLSPALDDVLNGIQDMRLNVVLARYADTGIWLGERNQVTLTDFGREFAFLLANALEEGYIGADEEEYMDQVLDYLHDEPFHPA